MDVEDSWNVPAFLVHSQGFQACVWSRKAALSHLGSSQWWSAGHVGSA